MDSDFLDFSNSLIIKKNVNFSTSKKYVGIQIFYKFVCTVRSEGFLYKSCFARAKKFTNYVFCHPQSSGVIQNIENRCAILTPIFVYVDYYQNNQFYRVKIDVFKILL